ncbi:hypothetical protein E4T43_07166 [Aureobasidium subglaciale]|nr:hypothetical protein E4T43_07166 [Aureobasidium subglaciale]
MDELVDKTVPEAIAYTHDRFSLQIWGFIIYRCTYGGDNAWAQFIHHIKQRTIDSFHRQDDAQILVPRLDIPVIEDPALEGASKSDIRRRFKEWVNINARLECTAAISAGQFQTLLREIPRFNFCIHVDAEVLDAVIRRGPSLDETMATVDEPMRTGLGTNTTRQHPIVGMKDTKRTRTLSTKDENEEEIEGCKLYDVGWMRVSVEDLMPRTYGNLIDINSWELYYHQPSDGVALIE